MIIGAINASRDLWCSYPLGRTSLFWSRLPLKQGVCRDPLAFERHVPPSIPRFQPYHKSQGQTLAEALQ
jgi:hypothetical protein